MARFLAGRQKTLETLPKRSKCFSIRSFLLRDGGTFLHWMAVQSAAHIPPRLSELFLRLSGVAVPGFEAGAGVESGEDHRHGHRDEREIQEDGDFRLPFPGQRLPCGWSSSYVGPLIVNVLALRLLPRRPLRSPYAGGGPTLAPPKGLFAGGWWALAKKLNVDGVVGSVVDPFVLEGAAGWEKVNCSVWEGADDGGRCARLREAEAQLASRSPGEARGRGAGGRLGPAAAKRRAGHRSSLRVSGLGADVEDGLEHRLVGGLEAVAGRPEAAARGHTGSCAEDAGGDTGRRRLSEHGLSKTQWLRLPQSSGGDGGHLGSGKPRGLLAKRRGLLDKPRGRLAVTGRLPERGRLCKGRGLAKP
ncbi:hypothetical protein EYF80_021197 [Liparis tanakae]|uniref:Uncharacterized protein n=1 Tax=Liparis tanakae TaxID=230148 RepID=A0A4Z2HSL7_9TELE|nr:hypothetical protein EYF80_021197 [Liparis tanakae]